MRDMITNTAINT